MTDDPGIRVTVEDLKTGDTSQKTITDDVVVITAGRHYVANVQKYRTGTQVWTISREDPT